MDDLTTSLTPAGGPLAANVDEPAREVDEGAEADEWATYGDADAQYDAHVERAW